MKWIKHNLRLLRYIVPITIAVIIQVSFCLSEIHAQTVKDFTVTLEFVAENAEMLSPEARDAIHEAVKEWPFSMTNGTFYLVSLRWEEAWALGTIVTVDKDEQEEAYMVTRDGLTFLLVNTEIGWQAALETSNQAEELLKYIPDTELEPEAKKALFSTDRKGTEQATTRQKYSGYKLPWPSETTYRLNSYYCPKCWHGTYPNTDYSLDFNRISGNNYNMLAPAPGTVTQVCKNTSGLQAWVIIKTQGTTETSTYMHLAQSSIPANIYEGATVSQGTFVGRLLEGASTEYSPCYMISSGTHLHFGFPSKPCTMDGYTFTTDSNGNLRLIKDGQEISIYSDLYSTQGQANTLCGELPANIYEGSYEVTCDIYINAGRSTHIYPGVTLDYKGHSLTVNGSLIWGP